VTVETYESKDRHYQLFAALSLLHRTVYVHILFNRPSVLSSSSLDFLSELAIRCFFSLLLSFAAYLKSGMILTSRFPRSVENRDTFKYDIKTGFFTLLFGTPIVQSFFLATSKWGISYGYKQVDEYGYLYWALSIPLYLTIWDFVFYAGHLFLHLPLVYRFAHAHHHRCRAPVAWSALCVDPVDEIFEGILPALMPLLVAPFHLSTVYAVNLALMYHAMWLHTSAKASPNPFLLTPKDHNLHHAYGERNYNFAVLFTAWDRMFGTYNSSTTAPWWEHKAIVH
jgi:lathosterol oxidase